MTLSILHWGVSPWPTLNINLLFFIISKIDKTRYTIHQGWSTEITLPEKVDCIIHELIGMWGNGERGIGYVAEFRDRNLKEGASVKVSWIASDSRALDLV